jgi:hypothetical protein
MLAIMSRDNPSDERPCYSPFFSTGCHYTISNHIAEIGYFAVAARTKNNKYKLIWYPNRLRKEYILTSGWPDTLRGAM